MKVCSQWAESGDCTCSYSCPTVEDMMVKGKGLRLDPTLPSSLSDSICLILSFCHHTDVRNS